MSRTLSVAIIAKNERRNLPRALHSVAELADEVIVLDGGSTDETAALACALGATVHTRAFDGFAAQKNAALDHCSGDYILVLDADEAVTPALAEAIRGILNDPDAAFGYAVARRSLFLGRFMRHSGWFPDYTTRLIRRNFARFSPALVHESLAVNGRVARIDKAAHLDHYTTESISAHLSKMNRYTSLAARDGSPRRRPGLLSLALLPMFTFLKVFVLKRGFRDGREGFILAALSSFYVFVKYWKFREAGMDA